MDSRREFLKRAALLAAGGAVSGTIPHSILRAAAIDPVPGSTYLDAEHVVILMQENRSFDHCYGTLRGVRGFNDPRAVKLPNGHPVWLQTNKSGETYAPFRLNIKDSKSTWMSSLPHTWEDQTDARNEGKHNGWLDAKQSGKKQYAHLPLTLGFYNREDIPFYYALADAFTVCDQNFCSSLTGTTPNRLYLWTGTIREQQTATSKANVRNEDVDYPSEARWKTFPERLEDAGISWRIYQNELSLPTGLKGEHESWLANFGDNPLEWFTQFRVRFSLGYRRNLSGQEKALANDLVKLETQPQPWDDSVKRLIETTRNELDGIRKNLDTWSEANFLKLPVHRRNLHSNAFTCNEGDPDYHQLSTFTYREGEVEREMQVPKGDVLHQFRQDTRSGKLPQISWIVAPEKFSDHPGTPWYGAWYLSEVLDILTENADLWRKTIFILCYDENDGYFDHIPPFVPPLPGRPDTGMVSSGIDTSVEHVRWEQEQERQRTHPDSAGRAGPIGLGFRVPLVIASPWSRGGYVCSQVFDHTSILRFLEKFLSHKLRRPIREPNISTWRRVVCGDLTSAFRPYHQEKLDFPEAVNRAALFGSIHQAQFKQVPSGFRKLNEGDVRQAMENPRSSLWLPKQEEGSRPSCALPYELSADGILSADRKSFEIRFTAGNDLFRALAAGAPFHVYSPEKTRSSGKPSEQFESGRTWAYAVVAGEQLQASWPLDDFQDGKYHLCVHGPNGFFREFQGSSDDPILEIMAQLERAGESASGNLVVRVSNRHGNGELSVVIEDLAYGEKPRTLKLGASGAADGSASVVLDLSRSFGWFDFQVRVDGPSQFRQQYAGRVETGRESYSDPQIGSNRRRPA